MKNLIIYTSAILGIFIIGLIAITYTTFSFAVVATMFYNWFILPIFPTLPHIGVLGFVGIMFFIGLFKTNSYKKDKKEDSEDNFSTIFTFIVTPWLVLLVGYLFHLIF